MFWLIYECFSIFHNAFLLKSAISSHNSCDASQDMEQTNSNTDIIKTLRRKSAGKKRLITKKVQRI